VLLLAFLLGPLMADSITPSVIARLPLAEAVLSLASWIFDAASLDATYEEHRGRCHNRLLLFPEFVHILFTCMSRPWNSARDGLLKAKDDGRLPVSFTAFYDKLKNTPVPVSLAFFRDCCARLRQVLPDSRPGCPPSLRPWTSFLIDGKVVKHVCRRLKELRLDTTNACKLLGPRSLVVADRWSGLLYDLMADLDGEANEVKYVSDLLDRIRVDVTGPYLIIGDRAFGVFKVCATIKACGGDFLLRKHGQTQFLADPTRPAVTTTDRFGRTVVQQWGWVVRGKETAQRRKIEVRQITVERAKEPLVLLSSLLDPVAHPVDDLLDAYLARWDIEGMFQKVSEEFGLRHLFSSSPQGMLFQLVLGFLMHNVVQVVKQVLVQEQERDEKRVSTALLFRDMQEELIAVARVLTVEETVSQISTFATAAAVRQRLRELLGTCWKPRWNKANYKPRDPTKPVAPKPRKIRQKKAHDSVQRILQRNLK
jgi:hypothetical protein